MPRSLRAFLTWLFLALALLAGCGQNVAPLRESGSAGASPSFSERHASARYDLSRDEQLGGHTLARHVGRTDAELQERLQREPNISAASTWTDRDAAETTVAEALHADRGRIDRWLDRGARRSNLALHFDAARVIGRSLQRGASQAVDCTRAVIVLRADGPNSFYVLTAYPEAR